MIRQKSNSLSLRTGQMFLFAALSITIMLMAILCSIKIIREHQVSYDNQTIMTYDARYSEQSQFGRNSFLGVEDHLEKPNTKNKITSHRVNLNPLTTFAVTNYALASTGQNVLLILGGIIVFLILTMVAITALVRKKKRKK